VVRFTPRSLNLRYSLDRRLGGPQIRSGRYGLEKVRLPVPGIGRLDHSLGATPTELSRLLQHNMENQKSALNYFRPGVKTEHSNTQVAIFLAVCYIHVVT
jgi:hypothetical protein